MFLKLVFCLILWWVLVSCGEYMLVMVLVMRMILVLRGLILIMMLSFCVVFFFLSVSLCGNNLMSLSIF